VDVGQIVAECVAAARRTHPDVVIEADLASAGDGDLVLVGDAGRLGQVVDNLVLNALLHGTAPVRVAVRPEGGDVVVTVEDSGAGIPPEMQERLFERFATGRARGGTGLGLFIVRQLARAHGGDASYRPRDGELRGAFVVRLPRTGAPAPDDAS
jgi:signal transduction histidine kinase